MSGATSCKSMTGYGRGSAEGEGIRVEVEMKGVNHRFLDLKMKLPPELASCEADLRAQVQRAVGRARLDVAFALLTTRPPTYRLDLNRDLIAAHLNGARALKKQFGLRGSVALESVLGLPGAVALRPEATAHGNGLIRLAERALSEALRGYDAMRATEGERLAEALRGHLSAIGAEVETIEDAARALPEGYARRLRERVASLAGQTGLDELRLAQEVALLADRLDITEEVVRLRGHLEQVTAALAEARGPVGKTLDFVMQEMNREANTIASKAECLPISQAALRIKAQVEQIREQAQNLE